MISGAVKVHGVPGTGKTFTLMRLYGELLDEGYTCEDITAVTFRTTSAEDLINHVLQKVDADRNCVKKHVGTIHSICNRLSSYGTLISPEDIAKFLKDYNYLIFVNQKKQSKDTAISGSNDEVVQSGDLFDMYT